MSSPKGLNPSRIIQYFRETDLEVAVAIHRACTDVVSGRVNSQKTQNAPKAKKHRVNGRQPQLNFPTEMGTAVVPTE